MYQNSSFQSLHDLKMSSGLQATLDIHINLPTREKKRTISLILFSKMMVAKLQSLINSFLQLFFPSEDRREVKGHLL